MIGKQINNILGRFNLKIIKTSINSSKEVDILRDNDFQELYKLCAPYTMTSMERMYALYNSIQFIVDNDIKGDIVECGVWKGGSAMLVAAYLKSKNIDNRKIYLYDTYEGMTQPDENDVDFKGELAADTFSELTTGEDSSDWCNAGIDEVKSNMSLTGYNTNNIVFIKGKIEDTIPENLPENEISLLRLDTDWYTSTKHELIHMYPLLVKSGVLIIDDFGNWEGAKKAVIEYFKEIKKPIFLNRIDYTGRIAIKG